MEATVPERILPFTDVFNFRDVGGYAGLDGQRVRWRRLFRSDSLHRLGGADRDMFTSLGVRTVIDMRRPHEVASIGRVPECAPFQYHNVYPEHAPWDDIPFGENDSTGRWLADRYLAMAAEGKDGLAAAIGLIADRDRVPVVVHCLAGKDRTGVLCALTLSLLGVCDDDIAADYALSTLGCDRFANWLGETTPAGVILPPPARMAPGEAIVLFLAELRERYGSVERYLASGGLGRGEVDALRANLLS